MGVCFDLKLGTRELIEIDIGRVRSLRGSWTRGWAGRPWVIYERESLSQNVSFALAEEDDWKSPLTQMDYGPTGPSMLPSVGKAVPRPLWPSVGNDGEARNLSHADVGVAGPVLLGSTHKVTLYLVPTAPTYPSYLTLPTIPRDTLGTLGTYARQDICSGSPEPLGRRSTWMLPCQIRGIPWYLRRLEVILYGPTLPLSSILALCGHPDLALQW